MLPLRATLFCRPLRIVRACNAGMHEACAILLVRRSATHNHLGALLLVDSPTQLSLLIAGRSWVSPRFLSSLSHRAMLIDPGKLNPLSPLIERSFMLDSSTATLSPLACIIVSRLICFRWGATLSLRPEWVPCLRLNLIFVRFVVPFRLPTLGSFPPHKLQDSVLGGWLSLTSTPFRERLSDWFPMLPYSFIHSHWGTCTLRDAKLHLAHRLSFKNWLFWKWHDKTISPHLVVCTRSWLTFSNLGKFLQAHFYYFY